MNISFSDRNIKPASVSQSSTFSWGGVPYGAERAIDGNMGTQSHTNCAWNTDIWYKMELGAVYCFPEIIIVQSHIGWYSYRMQDLKVLLVDGSAGTEHLCGTFRVNRVATIIGQTHSIPCDACGNQIKLLVRHDQREYPKSREWEQTQPACIHMWEIAALQTGS